MSRSLAFVLRSLSFRCSLRPSLFGPKWGWDVWEQSCGCSSRGPLLFSTQVPNLTCSHVYCNNSMFKCRPEVGMVWDLEKFPADASWSERLLCLTSDFIVTLGRTAKRSGCFTPSVWERSHLNWPLNIRSNKPIMVETFSRLFLVHRLASCNQVLESV